MTRRLTFAVFLLRMGGDRYARIRPLWIRIFFTIHKRRKKPDLCIFYIALHIIGIILAALYLITYNVQFFAQ